MRNNNNPDTLESEVRYYSRIFPAIFSKSKGCYLFDETGKKYLDFFSGAGAMNYGHNNALFKEKLISYIEEDGITHSLDMSTQARSRFIENFQNIILKKRDLEYKIQFTGPTGTDAIEAALKLARKYTGRKNIVYFSNSYHGMSMGSLSITPKSNRIGIPVGYTVQMPFYQENSPDNFAIENYLKNLQQEEYPAAIFLETIQAEGGINVASIDWLKRIETIANKHNILLVVDDIQVGVGRAGKFFSFERAQIKPDIVCLSKSISGYGLPLSMLLLKPHLDVWEAGEHTGTFRGFNLAFITANEAILHYWQDNKFINQVQNISEFLQEELSTITNQNGFSLYGLGMIFGVDVKDAKYASAIREKAFRNGLIFETCGPNRAVIKMIPPLTIKKEELIEGLEIFKDSLS